MQLLILSNGHGEDVIAQRIAEQLQHFPQAPQLAALPLVGEGHAYRKLKIPIIGTVQPMPSGGFIYRDARQLWRDVQGGLVNLTYQQYQSVRQWGKSGGKVLAVGDIFPLFLAWLSGADYGFVGTAKSEYYLRDESGWLSAIARFEGWSGSVYLPWERALMSSPRCKAVFPRDSLTAKVLQQWPVPVFDLGNPMMDGLAESQKLIPPTILKKGGGKSQKEELIFVLLPGSRMPEAQNNWQTMSEAVLGVMKAFCARRVIFLSAIAPALNLAPFEGQLIGQGWLPQSLAAINLPISDAQARAFSLDNATVILTQHAYADCLQVAQVAIAMAGTATEQFIGLGKPAIIVPGKGPQFTYAFAQAQTRLLGCSVLLVSQPDQVGESIANILQDPQKLQQIAENGRRRMGASGAAQRIAQCLLNSLFTQG